MINASGADASGRTGACGVSSVTRSTRSGSVSTSSRIASGPLIEPPDLSGAEPVRRDRVDEALALGRIGARQGHEVLHGSVRDQSAILDVLLDGLGERAHQAQAPRDPAHAAIEAPRQGVERQAVLLMQRAQQPALLERAVGCAGVQEMPKDEHLGLRHLPHDGGHRVALQPTQAATRL